MAGTKDIMFDPKDLLNLLTHYSDGEVPLSGEVTDFLVNQNLQRKIGLLVVSDEWPTSEPLFINYDGRRIKSWAKVDGQVETEWEQRAETPSRQN